MSQPPPSAAQPVICCIGESVSGQPTQFMIERSVASLGMDWRALSVEVPPEKFEPACRGMLAMGFKGLRLFFDYQPAAVNFLAQGDLASQFIGYATSGCAMDDHWSLWDHYGYAWLELTKSDQMPSEPLFWLHGNSRTTRSVFVALSSLGLSAPAWFWTDAESAIQDSFVQQLIASQKVANDNSHCIAARLGAEPESLLTAAEEKKQTVVYITESKTIPTQHADLLLPLDTHLAIHRSYDFPAGSRARNLIVVSQSDLAVSAEAYDFHRWTGRIADIGLMKDCYDEYCDFW
jgi:hypothetical protein